ncbi:hypothetical protein [Maritimibacter sp. DP1N21-5]|uniref:hypothetical protein n=1 Tax=Maritimibacter sp. DP1N21-5 TaxID=2836867 RepID=UPI001C469237|nr:hypothetical protein [Maritimibacter sp. DP1N21-5]MBV7408652.1 hypothetical protein [Maritimibacter sp. DP1N21-5]
MKRTMITLSVAAMLTGGAAFAQQANTLNESIYAQGMGMLQSEGYNVSLVRQDNIGNLTFMASSDAGGRVLVIDGEGAVVSDTMTTQSAGSMYTLEGEGMEEFGSNTIIFTDEGSEPNDGGYADDVTEVDAPDGGRELDIDVSDQDN